MEEISSTYLFYINIEGYILVKNNFKIPRVLLETKVIPFKVCVWLYAKFLRFFWS